MKVVSEDLWELSELLEDEDIDMIAAYIQATGSKLDSDTIEQAKDSFTGGLTATLTWLMSM